MTWDVNQTVAGAAILSGATGSDSDTQSQETPAQIDSENWSIFAQGEYDFTDQLTGIAGLRWSQDDKHLEMRRVLQDIPEGLEPTEVFNVDNFACEPPPAECIPGLDDIDYGDYAARLQLNYVPSDATLLYVSANRGIKGGNWSLDPLGGVAIPDLKHDEEVLWAYEVGIKQTFAGGLANLKRFRFLLRLTTTIRSSPSRVSRRRCRTRMPARTAAKWNSPSYRLKVGTSAWDWRCSIRR
jgi:outer membrane receptor protein involved in Fe transport